MLEEMVGNNLDIFSVPCLEPVILPQNELSESFYRRVSMSKLYRKRSGMKISDNVSQILDLRVIQRDLILLKKCSKCSKSVLKRKSQLRLGGSSEKVKTHLGELVPKRKNTPILAPWYLAAHKPVWDLKFGPFIGAGPHGLIGHIRS